MNFEEQHFQKIRDFLVFIYAQYIVLRELSHNKERLPEKYVRRVILNSLLRSYLQNLVNLVDSKEDKAGNKNLSIRWIQEPDEEFGDLVNKLKRYRDKVFSHLDVEHTLGFGDFVAEHPIAAEETKGLLEHLIDIIEHKGGVKFVARNSVAKWCKSEVRQLISQ